MEEIKIVDKRRHQYEIKEKKRRTNKWKKEK